MARILFKQLNQQQLLQDQLNPESVKPNVRIGRPKHIPPTVHVFFSAKGGSGTSLIAATVAGATRAVMNLRALLLDMDLPFGGVEPYAGAEGDRSILHLQPVLTELTDVHIRNVVQTDSVSGIDIIFGSVAGKATEASMLGQEDILDVLTEVKKHYDIILIDAGSKITPHAIEVMKQSDQIHYVLTPDTPSLRKYQQTLTVFQEQNIPADKLHVILNRVSKKNEIQIRDLKELHPLHIEGTIRSDFESLQTHINMGVPLITRIVDKKPPIVLKDIVEIARLIGGGKNR